LNVKSDACVVLRLKRTVSKNPWLQTTPYSSLTAESTAKRGSLPNFWFSQTSFFFQA
jgi:hypothetical protein